MSEIDPWALPQDGASGAAAGIPGTAPRQYVQPVAPLNRTLPIVVMALGVLYVAVSLVEVFVLSHEVSFANQLNALLNSGGNPSQDQVNQAQSDDNTINAVSWAALVVFLGALVAIGVCRRDADLLRLPAQEDLRGGCRPARRSVRILIPRADGRDPRGSRPSVVLIA